jgi:hypothetical protein
MKFVALFSPGVLVIASSLKIYISNLNLFKNKVKIISWFFPAGLTVDFPKYYANKNYDENIAASESY